MDQQEIPELPEGLVSDPRRTLWSGMLPTYNEWRFPKKVAAKELEEYGEPRMPAAVELVDALRVVLSRPGEDGKPVLGPDILIERQPQGWVFFLHPESGGDTVAYIYITDDGRTFFHPERPYHGSPELEILKHSDPLPAEFEQAADDK